jgi:two-component system sensor histidine kinase YesM
LKPVKSIFFKMNLIIFTLLMPILLLYAYSNRVSVRVIEEQLQKNNINQLEILRKQIEAMTDGLSMNSVILTRDPTILEVEISYLIGELYRMAQIEVTVLEKLKLQSTANNWSNDISVYFPSVYKLISTDLNAPVYNESYLKENVKSDWAYKKGRLREPSYFVYYANYPYNEGERVIHNNVIVEVKLYESNLIALLEEFKKTTKGDPFLMKNSELAIGNPTMSTELTKDVLKQLKDHELGNTGSRRLDIKEQKYWVNYVYVKSIDTYIVDYVPVDQILLPVTTSRNLFYSGILLLFVTGLAASYLLYKHVQVPLHSLIGVLRRFKDGNYSVRIHRRFQNEFDILIVRFNEMAEVIQDLIENVYEEKSRSRLATLKQLQAQINPHFLYNCLFFIASCAHLGKTESVLGMSYKLGNYYKYMTRLQDQTPLLVNELQLIENFLEIHKMRLQRIHYEIEVNEELLTLRVPRLLLQPIVENAVVHGLEPQLGGGTIWVTARKTVGSVMLTVEDDGIGISDDVLKELKKRLTEDAIDEEQGYGMWNVNQRLKYWYGESAKLEVETVSSGGVKVTLQWKLGDGEEKRSDIHDPYAGG